MASCRTVIDFTVNFLIAQATSVQATERPDGISSLGHQETFERIERCSNWD